MFMVHASFLLSVKMCSVKKKKLKIILFVAKNCFLSGLLVKPEMNRLIEAQNGSGSRLLIKSEGP